MVVNALKSDGLGSDSGGTFLMQQLLRIICEVMEMRLLEYNGTGWPCLLKDIFAILNSYFFLFLYTKTFFSSCQISSDGCGQPV